MFTIPDMAGIKIIPTLIRENFIKPQFPREPEPDLIMDSSINVEAYKNVGEDAREMGANYLFQIEEISKVIKHCATVIDLACGPATILCMIAELNPKIQFVGVDLSEGMLALAKQTVQQKGLKNVAFQKMDISNLVGIGTNSVDGVISTMALHHLPTQNHLVSCFKEISRVVKSNGAIYLADFTRLKSLKSVFYFAYRDRYLDHVFALDYERSLRASFTFKEFRELAKNYLPASVCINKTYLVPVMMIVKTKSYPIDKEVLIKLKKRKKGFKFKFLMVYYEIKLFFFLGGLRD